MKTGLTKLRSNTTAHTVAIGLKTRTKPNGIKIHYTCAGIRGHARLFPGMTAPFMSPLAAPARPTHAGTAASIFPGLVLHRTIVLESPTIRIGTRGYAICKTRINSENATRLRSSLGRIISGSISSTVMQVLVGNGPTCLRMHA